MTVVLVLGRRDLNGRRAWTPAFAGVTMLYRIKYIGNDAEMKWEMKTLPQWMKYD